MRVVVEIAGGSLLFVAGLLFRLRRVKRVEMVDEWINEENDAIKNAAFKEDKNYVKIRPETPHD